jgi:hypothetical protein
MDPVTLGVIGAIVVGGLLLGGLVTWWTFKAAVSMLKRAVALMFVLCLTGLLVVAALLSFAMAHR